MTSLGFLTAVYNEEEEIADLLESVSPYVDDIVVSDDGSTDQTVQIALGWADCIVLSEPTHSCEETRIRGLARSTADWILILDADERVPEEYLHSMKRWLDIFERDNITHVYFKQIEIMDGASTRQFNKIKLARRDKLILPEVIHGDISVEGKHLDSGWTVMHRKTSEKQKMRELEYLAAYEEKVAQGKMTQEWADKVKQWHYFHK